MKSDELIACQFLQAGMIISDGSVVMEVVKVLYRSTFGVRFIYREFPNGEEYISRIMMGRPEFYYFGTVQEMEMAA